MHQALILDKNFKNIDYTTNELPKAEYDNCTFIDCNFSDSYLTGINFLECEFIDCNFSSAKVKGVTFNNIVFKNCKLLGLPFYDCNSFLLSMQFIGCQLSLASFNNLNLKDSSFRDCKLEKVDFTNVNLSTVSFSSCDLNQAIFNNTNLEKTDFRSSYNYSFSPENNKIKGAKFSKEEVLGLLKSYNIIIE